MSFESCTLNTEQEPIFTFKSQEKTKVRYKCNLCAKDTVISAQTSSNYALKRHLQSKHSKEDCNQFDKILKKNKSFGIISTVASKQNDLLTFGYTKETPAEALKHQACKVGQEDIDKSVVNLIMGAGLPFSFVEKDVFRDFVRKLQPGRTVITYKTLLKRMEEQFTKMKSEMVQFFSNLDHVCITSDLWTGSKRGYLGITAHWLNDDLTRGSCALACTRMKGSHTNDAIAKAIEDTLVEFGLQNKCHFGGCVTDNGGNFVKAFFLFADRPNDQNDIRDYGETTIDVEIDIGINEEDTLGQNADPEERDLVQIDIAIIIEDERQNRPILPAFHHRCSSHTLNLVAKEDSENALRNADFKKICRSAFAKCTAVWNKQRSTLVAEFIKENYKLLFIVPVVTRWNSMYDAMERFLRILETSNDNLRALFDRAGFTKYLSAAEIKFIKEYCLVMRPVAQALDYLQGEYNMYLGHLLPTIVSLKQMLRDVNQSLQICGPLVVEIQKGIDKRFGSYMNKKKYLLASILLPSRKDLQDFTNEQKANARQFLVEEVETIMNNNTTALDPVNDETVNDNANPFAPRKRQKVRNDPHQLVNEYLNSDCCDLSLLKTMPIMEKLFRKYNCSLPSSAPVERMFSHGGIILSKRRAQLSDDNFLMQLLLKINQKFWKDEE